MKLDMPKAIAALAPATIAAPAFASVDVSLPLSPHISFQTNAKMMSMI
jgi:hypothetical protein